MKILTTLLVAMLSFQTYCPVQMGVHIFDDVKGRPAAQHEDCSTSTCLDHESKNTEASYLPEFSAAPVAPQIHDLPTAEAVTYQAELSFSHQPLFNQKLSSVLRI